MIDYQISVFFTCLCSLMLVFLPIIIYIYFEYKKEDMK